MGCTGGTGHPQYQEGQVADQLFDENELLYRRYKLEQFQNQQLLPSAFKFPRQSFNRGKFSLPEDVLHPECCQGQSLSDWGVLECSLGNLPTPVEGADGRGFHFSPVHQPLECCYAHTEIWCKTGDGEVVEEPSKKVKHTFRVILARRMTVRIPASV